MPDIVDPAIPLADFQKAVRAHRLSLFPCKNDPGLFLHFDVPKGNTPRMTFARIADGEVTAFVMFVPGDPYKGLTAFSVGIAVPEKYRRQGRATEVLRAAIEEVKLVSKAGNVSAFYVDAVVSVDNTASRALSVSFFGEEGVPVIDHQSGKPALQFFKHVIVD